MSQPPQSGWGPSGDAYGQGGDAYGQGGYGAADGGYGQSSANAGYGAAPAGGYGQPSPSPAFGQSFAPEYSTGPTEQLGPPKKGGAGKIVLFACIGCAVLALLLGLIGGGIFFFTRDAGGSDDPTPSATTGGEETTATEQPTNTGPGTGDPTTSATPTAGGQTTGGGQQAAGSGKGTKDSPYAPGQKFTLDDGDGGKLDVTIGDVNWDATKAVMDKSEFNTQPGADETYILVPVTLTYHGDKSVMPFMAISLQYVAKSGNSYRDSGTLAPDGAIEENEVFDGGTVSFNEAMVIPKSAVKDGGAFQVDVVLNFSGEPVWVAAP